MAFTLERATCCCGCDVKTGTSILLWLALIWNGLIFLFGVVNVGLNGFTVTFLIISIIGGAGLYGLSENKPQMLIPFFIYRILNFIGCILVVLLLIFAQQVITKLSDALAGGLNNYPSYKYDTYMGQPEINFNKLTSDTFSDSSSSGIGGFLESLFYVLLILIILWAILEYHFMSVVYSYYKQMQRELMSGRAQNGGVLSMQAPDVNRWGPGQHGVVLSVPAPGGLSGV